MSSLDGVMVIGLTGQTGAGKTTACKVFENNGFTIINADEVARRIMEPETACLNDIIECFGKAVLNDDNSLNRQGLADIVFKDSKKLELLNSITYPYITSEILTQININSDNGHKLILLDAPTLFESRADDFCEIIISVIADSAVRLKRIMHRDGLSEQQATDRINSQHSEKFFVDNSDFIIENNNTDTKALNDIVDELSDKIKSFYSKKYKDME